MRFLWPCLPSPLASPDPTQNGCLRRGQDGGLKRGPHVQVDMSQELRRGALRTATNVPVPTQGTAFQGSSLGQLVWEKGGPSRERLFPTSCTFPPFPQELQVTACGERAFCLIQHGRVAFVVFFPPKDKLNVGLHAQGPFSSLQKNAHAVVKPPHHTFPNIARSLTCLNAWITHLRLSQQQ